MAERHYVNVHRGVPMDAHTLEDAMQVEPLMRELVAGSTAAVVALRAVEG